MAQGRRRLTLNIDKTTIFAVTFCIFAYFAYENHLNKKYPNRFKRQINTETSSSPKHDKTSATSQNTVEIKKNTKLGQAPSKPRKNHLPKAIP